MGAYSDKAAEFTDLMAGWLAEGVVTWEETVREGLDNAPQDFLDLLAGGNTGTMVVPSDGPGAAGVGATRRGWSGRDEHSVPECC
ncbi:hypothetical protein ACOCJ4_07945 [Knoellia sp. CPCC 206435]|uniref:hypothetical protein n=1 Tax=Knoellia terrae TaxID=3404797 RepID=UPI003B43AAD8